MKITRYIYKNLIKTGFIINNSTIINVEDLKLDYQKKLNPDEEYIIKHGLYNVDPIFLIDLINKKIITSLENYDSKHLVELEKITLLSPLISCKKA